MHGRTISILTLCFALVPACSTSTSTQASAKDSGGDGGASDTNSAGGASSGGASSGGASSGGATSASGGGGGGSSVVVADLSCSTYCTAIQTNCATESVKQYKSLLSCTSSCAAFLLGSTKDSSGNTLGCRAHYAALAEADPAANCAAAGPSGGGRCGTNCDAYCALMARVCPTVFDDDALCRASCLTMIGVDDTIYRYGLSGDNLQCRIYHTTFGAEGFPEIHCPHASPVPMSPCSG